MKKNDCEILSSQQPYKIALWIVGDLIIGTMTTHQHIQSNAENKVTGEIRMRLEHDTELDWIESNI